MYSNLSSSKTLRMGWLLRSSREPRLGDLVPFLENLDRKAIGAAETHKAYLWVREGRRVARRLLLLLLPPTVLLKKQWRCH